MPREWLGIGNTKETYYRDMKESFWNSQGGKEIPYKEKNTTNNSHGGSHNKRRKKKAKENGIKGTSQEDLDGELDELKQRISMIENLLEQGEKNQWYGWILRKKRVRWKLL